MLYVELVEWFISATVYVRILARFAIMLTVDHVERVLLTNCLP